MCHPTACVEEIVLRYLQEPLLNEKKMEIFLLVSNNILIRTVHVIIEMIYTVL